MIARERDPIEHELGIDAGVQLVAQLVADPLARRVCDLPREQFVVVAVGLGRTLGLRAGLPSLGGGRGVFRGEEVGGLGLRRGEQATGFLLRDLGPERPFASLRGLARAARSSGDQNLVNSLGAQVLALDLGSREGL